MQLLIYGEKTDEINSNILELNLCFTHETGRFDRNHSIFPIRQANHQVPVFMIFLW